MPFSFKEYFGVDCAEAVSDGKPEAVKKSNDKVFYSRIGNFPIIYSEEVKRLGDLSYLVDWENEDSYNHGTINSPESISSEIIKELSGKYDYGDNLLLSCLDFVRDGKFMKSFIKLTDGEGWTYPKTNLSRNHLFVDTVKSYLEINNSSNTICGKNCSAYGVNLTDIRKGPYSKYIMTRGNKISNLELFRASIFCACLGKNGPELSYIVSTAINDGTAVGDKFLNTKYNSLERAIMWSFCRWNLYTELLAYCASSATKNYFTRQILKSLGIVDKTKYKIA